MRNLRLRKLYWGNGFGDIIVREMFCGEMLLKLNMVACGGIGDLLRLKQRMEWICGKPFDGLGRFF